MAAGKFFLPGDITGNTTHARDITGNYTSVTDTVLDRNLFTNTRQGSVATKTLTSSTPQTRWAFNFCADLVFPDIVAVRHSFTSSNKSDFPVAVARDPTGCEVVIETNPAAAGTMVVDVDTSTYST